jgi:hypothetical protein
MKPSTAPGNQAGRPARGGRSLIPVADVTNAFGSGFAAVALALAAAYVVAADVRPWLGARDGLISWTTTAAYAIALVIGVWAARRSTREGNFRLLIPVAATLLLGQQVRWGADAIGLPLPTLSGVEVGSLVDLREVVSLNAERLGLGTPTGLAVLAVILGATAAAAAWARRWADERVLVTEAPVVMWFVASLGCAAAVPAFGIFGDGSGAWFATGVAGLLSSGFLAMAALAAGDHRRTVAGWRRRMWPWIADEGPLSGIPGDSH